MFIFRFLSRFTMTRFCVLLFVRLSPIILLRALNADVYKISTTIIQTLPVKICFVQKRVAQADGLPSPHKYATPYTSAIIRN